MRVMPYVASYLSVFASVRSQSETGGPNANGTQRTQPIGLTSGLVARGLHEAMRPFAFAQEAVSARASGQKFAPYSTQRGMCMDVQNARLASGSAVQIWQCSGGDNQQWRLEGPLFQTHKNMCLDVPSGNAYNGARLQVWECDGKNKNQQWNQVGNSLQWMGSQKYCVDVPDGNLNNGQMLQLWTCYPGSANQAFSLGQEQSTGNAPQGSPASSDATNFYGYKCISLDAFVAKYPQCAPYKGALQSAAADQGINPTFLGSIAMVESNCNEGITGRNAGNKNAKYGPFQFMWEPSWTEFGGASRDKTNFWDAAYGAARYFRSLIIQNNGNLHQAMRNYNGEVQNGGDANYQAHCAAFMGGYG